MVFEIQAESHFGNRPKWDSIHSKIVAGWRPLTQCFLCFTITTILPYYYLNTSHLLIDMCSFQPIIMAFQASIVTPTPCHHHHAYVVTEPLSSWDVAMSWAMPLGDTSALPPEMKCVL